MSLLDHLLCRYVIGTIPVDDLIGILGPYIGFAGTVWTGTPQLEVFTPLYPFHTNPHETEVFTQVTRALAAAKRAIFSLRERYTKLLASPAKPRSSEPFYFPYKTFYQVGDDEPVHFRYIERLYTIRLLFRVTDVRKRTPLIVKFTRRYSEAAHRYSAEKGIAPALYAVEKLPGGWMMVVMEYLDPDSYRTLRSSGDDLYARTSSALGIFHDGRFAHGDVRDENMMIQRQWTASETLPGVKFLDFDWAGESGKVVYPAHLNADLRRPKDAHEGLAITQAHDKETLDFIFNKLP